MKEELCAFSTSKGKGSVPWYRGLGRGSVTAEAQLLFYLPPTAETGLKPGAAGLGKPLWSGLCLSLHLPGPSTRYFIHAWLLGL